MRNIKIITGVLAVVFFLGLTGVAIAGDTDEFDTYSARHPTETERSSASNGVEMTTPSNGVERISPVFCTVELVDQNKKMMVNDCTKEDLNINQG